ncbi:MAG: FHA domain-containing protein [Methanomicrobiales archaeon]|nr:FHA domain-containing protein [Methanomicrobiales archaeon]
MQERDDASTLILRDDPDFIVELSEYLDVLSSSARLRILKLIEKKPKDARTISSEIETSYENTKKHLDKLLGIGVIRREAGLGKPTSKGVHPVWEYSLVPGSLEGIVRSLGIFGNLPVASVDRNLSERLKAVRGKISEELIGSVPFLMVNGGAENGKVHLLQEKRTRIGRTDPEGKPEAGDIILAEDYRAVTRVTKPHAVIVREGSSLVFQDCSSTGGSTVNGVQVQPEKKVLLHDGDLIELARGISGVRLLLTVPGSVDKGTR